MKVQARARVGGVMDSFECFCGDRFESRDQLVSHNVDEHDMTRAESQRKVDEKYPGSEA